MADVVNINVERANAMHDNKLVSPIETLRDALSDFESGDVEATSLMVIRLNKGPDGDIFDTGWWASNLSSSEMVALLEAVKMSALRDMGFT